MIEGAAILLTGMVIGVLICMAIDHLFGKRNALTEEKPYDKYKNIDGLYSRRAVKGK